MLYWGHEQQDPSPPPSPAFPKGPQHHAGQQQWEARPPAPSPGSIGWSGKGSRKTPARSVATAPAVHVSLTPEAGVLLLRPQNQPGPCRLPSSRPGGPHVPGEGHVCHLPGDLSILVCPQDRRGVGCAPQPPTLGPAVSTPGRFRGPGVPRSAPLSPLTARLRSPPSPSLGGRRCSSCPPRCSPPRGTPGPGARWARVGGAGLAPGAAVPGICPPP